MTGIDDLIAANDENQVGNEEILQTKQQLMDNEPAPGSNSLARILGVVGFPATLLCSWFLLQPNESAVLTSFGNYADSLSTPGCHFYNCWGLQMRKVSTKQISVELQKTTVLDSNGNPLIISAVFVYSIVNARKALLDIENVHTFVTSQGETSLKQTLCRFPYESHDGSPCLKTEAEHIGKHLCNILQQKVMMAGALIHSFQLKEISYSPEIASSMLKRQQAVAIVEARQTIVQGAVDIAVDAIMKIEQRGVTLSQDEAGRLVSNLITVICSDSDAQPTIPLSTIN